MESIGFIFNPYDGCIANRIVNGKQHTVRFHVDDLMASHMNPKVNDKFLEWLNKKYGSHGKVKATRGKVHEFLGVTYDFRTRGVLKLRMDNYVVRMLEAFSVKLTDKDVAATPAGNNLLERGTGKRLDPKRSEEFHSQVAKGLFLSKRARPDIHPVISVLATRIQSSNESDWRKLVRLMKYLNGTREFHLTLKMNDEIVFKWSIDASFAVHPDYMSQTGAVMTMGKGAMQSVSRKQKLNTRSSTEAELVAVDDVMTMVLWTRLFWEAQGYKVKANIILQDNKSAILLEKNGRKSAGKRSRALNVRYFFVTDQIEKKRVTVAYCRTDDMTGDYMTKPLQGEKFLKFRNQILGMD